MDGRPSRCVDREAETGWGQLGRRGWDSADGDRQKSH